MRYDSPMQMYPLLHVSVMLIAGIILGDALCGVVAFWMWLCGFAGALVVAVALYRWSKSPVCNALALSVAIAMCGAYLVSFRAQRLSFVFDGNWETCRAVVSSDGVPRKKTVRYELTVADGRMAGHRVYGYFAKPCDQLHIGEGMTVTAKFKGFDCNQSYARWLQVHDIVASAYVAQGRWRKDVFRLDGLSFAQRMQVYFGNYRQRLLSRYRHDMLSPEAFAVVSAMTLGDKTSLTSALRDTYSVSGASHVLALSGLHLGIIYFLLSFIFLRGRLSCLMQPVVIIAVWGYVAMAGMPLSMVRAAVMLTLFSLCSMSMRRHVSLNTLSFAAVVILYTNPHALWDVGFQLSFLAVLGILVFNGRLRKVLPSVCATSSRIVEWTWSMITVSLSAQIMVAPLIAYYFGRFSCFFLLSNFIAIPLSTLLVYTSVAMYLTPFWPWLNAVLAAVVGREAELLNRALGMVASLPGASVDGIRVSLPQLVLVYVFIFLVYVLMGYVRKIYLCHYGFVDFRKLKTKKRKA